jgi:hypothetical protein
MEENKVTTIGMHAWFARAETGVSSETMKPAANATAWKRIPDLEEGIEFNPNEEYIEHMRPNPTVLALADRFIKSRKLELTVHSKSIGPLQVELLLGTQAISTASTYANPSRGTSSGVRGWLRVQAYDKDDTGLIYIDVWCQLSIRSSTTMSSSDAFKADIVAAVLANENNIITLP